MLRDIYEYFIAWYRYHIYYRFPHLKFLLRKKVISTFEYRLTVMNKECLNKGQCVMCGCKTTALQFTNKACEGKCYPEMFK